MNSSRPLILISNDDGVSARGIVTLTRVVSTIADVIVVAPDGARSGQSSALTVNGPLFLNECAPIDTAYVMSCNGTPVDCVKLALHSVVPRKPDLVLAGINHGSNAAINNIYSGTMGAVMEACLQHIPAVGLSLLDHSMDADFSQVQPLILPIVKNVLKNSLPDNVCLNINFPAHCIIKGVKTVTGAQGEWSEEYKQYATPSGEPFYWLTGKFHNLEPDNDRTDQYWLDRGYATIVPIRPDQSATDAVSTIKSMFNNAF